MERDIIHIDEELCTGCGLCIPNCQEGALQLIDNKARLVSELMCDGLGACIGHCPEGAITIERREAAPYDERSVMEEMAGKGKNLVIAHLKHLKDHEQTDYMKEGMSWLIENKEKLNFDPEEIKAVIHGKKPEPTIQISGMADVVSQGCGCQGSAAREIQRPVQTMNDPVVSQGSELRQWPVQFHLINPAAAYFKDADLLLAADCAAFSHGDFHRKFIKNHVVVIACPKLDQGKESYLNKLVSLIDDARVNTIRVVMMEVPCCGGLLHLVKQALQYTSRKVPVKCTVISTSGEVLSDSWI